MRRESLKGCGHGAVHNSLTAISYRKRQSFEELYVQLPESYLPKDDASAEISVVDVEPEARFRRSDSVDSGIADRFFALVFGADGDHRNSHFYEEPVPSFQGANSEMTSLDPDPCSTKEDSETSLVSQNGLRSGSFGLLRKISDPFLRRTSSKSKMRSVSLNDTASILSKGRKNPFRSSGGSFPAANDLSATVEETLGGIFSRNDSLSSANPRPTRTWSTHSQVRRVAVSFHERSSEETHQERTGNFVL